MIPGFFTDILGLLLLVPAVRRALFGRLRDRVTIVRGGTSRQRPPERARTIDLDSDEYRHVEDKDSPWRREKDGED